MVHAPRQCEAIALEFEVIGDFYRRPVNEAAAYAVEAANEEKG